MINVISYYYFFFLHTLKKKKIKSDFFSDAAVEIFLSVGESFGLEISVPVEPGRSQTTDFGQQGRRQLAAAGRRAADVRHGSHVGCSQGPFHRV